LTKAIIVIPARFGSTRLPGKPLADIAGVSLLHRVCKVAQAVRWPELEVAVATDDERIVEHANAIGVNAVMTSNDCESGTDRVFDAVNRLQTDAELVINMQGDAPFTPPDVVVQVLDGLASGDADIATPVHRLSWQELDDLRASKLKTPFSGTTAIVNQSGLAVWFSKNIIPAIRKEQSLREQSAFSPVFKHVGLYGYRRKALKTLVAAPVSYYEVLEGLEQLRFLEQGLSVQAVEVSFAYAQFGIGVD
jgi:3-deoxy-manno-octulosonate cytidylyltransferase (CMP-KDO synthetase)